MSGSIQEQGPTEKLPPDCEDLEDKQLQIRIKYRKKPKDLLYKMLNLFKEVIIMLVFAVVYSALTNNPSKVSKSPAAYPFFPLDSPVTDWYRGEISKAIEQARSTDIAFVMFYAPWDAQSQTTRREFDLVARIMHESINFVAVNCWQPGSECRRQYSKVYRWPVLIAYPSHGRGVQYNGPLTALHMLRFLNNICQPLIVPQRVDELLAVHDAVVLGQLDALPGSTDYLVFYLTALRYLERDPFKDISFAILPQSRLLKRRITLYLWNETKEYDEAEWTSDGLTNWILNNLHKISNWMSPSGMKSLSLSSYVKNKTTLMLFTPRNPLLKHNYYYSLLKEIAYEYNNCAEDEIIRHRQDLLHLTQLSGYLSYQELKQKCSTNTKATTINNMNGKIITHVPKIWTNISVNEICNRECRNFQPKCSENKIKTSMLANLNENFVKFYFENKCRTFLSGQKFGHLFYYKNSTHFDFNVTGLACKTNKTLSFIAIDSLKYHHFAEKLGLDLYNSSDQTAAVIIDEKAETHYVLEEKVTELNLRLFIYNFTNNLLSRALSSPTSIKSKNTHSYPIVRNSSNYFVEELDAKTFLPKLLQLNKVVIVSYYSKQCAFCSGVAHIFLSAAKLFSPLTDIEFTRIDGDLNLLPWEYTMETYPTILFVPSQRKSESRVFPQSLPITVPNLIGFILTNLESEFKLSAMWSICNQTKFDEDRNHCISSVRYEILSMIERTLKKYRKSTDRQRAGILYKLQILRRIHLLLAHSSWQHRAIEENLKRLNCHKEIHRKRSIPKRDEL